MLGLLPDGATARGSIRWNGTELIGMRVFAGYAGWGPEQLADELDEGAWMVVDARDTDLISPLPESLWREVLRRQEGDVRFWATFPDDPSTN